MNIYDDLLLFSSSSNSNSKNKVRTETHNDSWATVFQNTVNKATPDIVIADTVPEKKIFYNYNGIEDGYYVEWGSEGNHAEIRLIRDSYTYDELVDIYSKAHGSIPENHCVGVTDIVRAMRKSVEGYNNNLEATREKINSNLDEALEEILSESEEIDFNIFDVDDELISKETKLYLEDKPFTASRYQRLYEVSPKKAELFIQNIYKNGDFSDLNLDSKYNEMGLSYTDVLKRINAITMMNYNDLEQGYSDSVNAMQDIFNIDSMIGSGYQEIRKVPFLIATKKQIIRKTGGEFEDMRSRSGRPFYYNANDSKLAEDNLEGITLKKIGVTTSPPMFTARTNEMNPKRISHRLSGFATSTSNVNVNSKHMKDVPEYYMPGGIPERTIAYFTAMDYQRYY